MAHIKLPRLLTPPVLQAVRDNLTRCFDAWLQAERSRASPQELADLQAAYERANATYREAMDRATAEGVPLDAP